MSIEEFNEKKRKLSENLMPGEKLVVKEPVFSEDTGEVLFSGAVYKVFGEGKYRTQDNPINANLDTEIQKGVSVADFSDYVDNRDVIRALIAHSQNSKISLRRFVNDMAKEDGLDDDYAMEDCDLDEIDDLELLTQQQAVAEAIASAKDEKTSSVAEIVSDKEEERSDDDEEQASQAKE